MISIHFFIYYDFNFFPYNFLNRYKYGIYSLSLLVVMKTVKLIFKFKLNFFEKKKKKNLFAQCLKKEYKKIKYKDYDYFERKNKSS